MKSSFFKIFDLLAALAAIVAGAVVFGILAALAFYLLWGSYFIIIYGIFAVTFSVFTGALTYVVFSIPFDLAVKFDPIKNDIASGKLSDLNGAQKTIGEFAVSFFNYVGADVVGGKVYFKGSYLPSVIECETDIEGIPLEMLRQKKRLRIDKNHKAYYLPVIFEEEELGYLILITKGFTFPFFYSILEYFEDYSLDDQVMCLVRR